jgi:hypothetical protein
MYFAIFSECKVVVVLNNINHLVFLKQIRIFLWDIEENLDIDYIKFNLRVLKLIYYNYSSSLYTSSNIIHYST